VCIHSARIVLKESVSTKKLIGASMKLPFVKSAKRLLQGVNNRSQEAKYCIRICSKECTYLKTD
jgi:hypothetical protein